MSEFTEMLRRKGYDYDNTRELTDAMNEAADIIDELESALRNVTAWKSAIELIAPSLGGALSAMYHVEAVLTKLERK